MLDVVYPSFLLTSPIICVMMYSMFVFETIEHEFQHLPNNPLDRMYMMINDGYFIEGVIDALIRDEPKKLEAAKKNPKAVGWFVGQIMTCTGNRANVEIMNRLLEIKIATGK